MRISGSGGCLRCGYQPAALLRSWTLTRTEIDPPAYDLAAQLYDVDAFWTRQGPMTVDLQMGARKWTWTVEPVITQRSLAATLEGVPLIH